MLLQSWGGVVRIFPAVPAAWADVSFEDLRAEGGYRVSARRKDGRTVAVSIRAEHAGRLRLRDPFGGRPASWSRGDVAKSQDDDLVNLRAGETLEGTAGAE
jgi:alpha-L-fucosidase 2